MKNSAGYEEERNLNDTGWKIIYRIDASYFKCFSSKNHWFCCNCSFTVAAWIYRS